MCLTFKRQRYKNKQTYDISYLMASGSLHLIGLLCEEDEDPEEAGEEDEDGEAREGRLLREFWEDGGASVEESPWASGQDGGISS